MYRNYSLCSSIKFDFLNLVIPAFYSFSAILLSFRIFSGSVFWWYSTIGSGESHLLELCVPGASCDRFSLTTWAG